jgi:hypothetical protein
LVAKIEKMFDVATTGEIEFAGRWFVKIPRNIGLDGIETTGDHFAEAIFPKFRFITEIMIGTTDVTVGLTVFHKVVAADCEGARRKGKE